MRNLQITFVDFLDIIIEWLEWKTHKPQNNMKIITIYAHAWR